MAKTSKVTKKVLPAFISLVALSVALGPAQPLQAAGQDKPAEPAKQEGGEKPTNQDKQGRGDPGNNEVSTKDGNTVRVTITVLNEQLVPIKDAVVILFAPETQERKLTGGDGKVAFQIQQGQLTLRITADRMDPLQLPLTSTGKPKDSVVEVVLKKSK